MARSFRSIHIAMVLLLLMLMPLAVFAQQEHGGQEHGGATEAQTPAEPAPAAPEPASPAVEPAAEPPAAEPAAEAPAPAPVPEPAPVTLPTLRPITITFSGELTQVEAQGTPAKITARDRYGEEKEIEAPPDAAVTAGGAKKALSDLKVGDPVTVEYQFDVATGKRTAKTITVGAGAPSE